MVPGASAPGGGSAVNAILAALQRGPEAIRLPASPFVLPAAVPGQAPDAAAPASFSRMMMGQLLAAMDRTAAVPTSVLSSVSPHLEGVPTGLAAPPPLIGPVVGPPPGRGSPGTAAIAVPLADGGNTPGQQETDQIGTSSGEVRPLAALPASSLTRLTAAARALIRVAPTDPTAVEPLRGAMLRSLDGLEVSVPAPAPAPEGLGAGTAEPHPLRPLRRAVEIAPAAELVSLAQWIVQMTPAVLVPVAPEAPRPLTPSPLPQPGQRFQDVLAAVSARTEVEGPVMEPRLPAQAGIPVSSRPATDSRSVPADPATPLAPHAEPVPPPAVGRAVVVSAPLAPEAAIARSAAQAYDASSRFVGRPGLPASIEPFAMPIPAMSGDAITDAIPSSRAKGMLAEPAGGRAAAPRPDLVRPAPAGGPQPAVIPSPLSATAVATPGLPVTDAGLHASSMTPLVPARAGGPAMTPAPLAASTEGTPPPVPAELSGRAPAALQAGPGVTSGPVQSPLPIRASSTAVPTDVAHRSSSMPHAADAPPREAPGQVATPTGGRDSIIQPVVIRAGSADVVPMPLAPVAASSASGAPAVALNPMPAAAAFGRESAPATSVSPGGIVANAVAPAVPVPAVTIPNPAPVVDAGRPRLEPEGTVAVANAGTGTADAVRPATPSARPAGDEGDPMAKPREDAGALFARIHAAASGRPADAAPADGTPRPAYPALADALDRIAAELSRAKPGAPRSLEMNIEAPDLGRVRIRVAMTDAGTVGIELVTPDQRAANALRADLPQLTASLEGRGQVVSGAQVTVAAVGFMAGQDGSGQSKSSHRWFEARGGRQSADGEDEVPVTGAVTAYRRPWAAVDLVA